MKDQLNKAIENIKEFWLNLPKKKKILYSSAAGGVLLLAIVAVALLNTVGGSYKVLYTGISSAESQQVYAQLQQMSVNPQMNEKGEVMVPKNRWDEIVLDLAGRGFPKTAPAYGVFLDNTGLTTTEYEKKQILLFQLQDRMQETIGRIEGVESATVTIDMPQESGYVWDSTKEVVSSAGVLIHMTPGYTLSPERVSAVKNLIAFSVPKMKVENVKIIDAATGVEMDSLDEAQGSNNYDFKRLDYERQVEKRIEDNIKRLLSPRYGADGVTAVAKVTLDYDKTVSESKELVPRDDGNGVKTHEDEKYQLEGQVPADGLVGEENNTDIPTYPNQTGDGTGGVTNYERNTDYDISYILTQIEKGQAVLKTASVAVVVNDNNFTTERRDLLIDLISKGVNITPSAISVTNLDFSDEADAAPTIMEFIAENRMVLIAAVGALIMIILILIIISSILRSSRRKKQGEEAIAFETATAMGLAPMPGESLKDVQMEINEHKRRLKETAEVTNTRENAMANEIRTFAKENPEITASLIRSMLKEDE